MKFFELNLQNGEIAVIKVVKSGIVYTMGDMNALGGMCDCCKNIDDDDEIEILHRDNFTSLYSN